MQFFSRLLIRKQLSSFIELTGIRVKLKSYLCNQIGPSCKNFKKITAGTVAEKEGAAQCSTLQL